MVKVIVRRFAKLHKAISIHAIALAREGYNCWVVPRWVTKKHSLYFCKVCGWRVEQDRAGGTGRVGHAYRIREHLVLFEILQWSIHIFNTMGLVSGNNRLIFIGVNIPYYVSDIYKLTICIKWKCKIQFRLSQCKTHRSNTTMLFKESFIRPRHVLFVENAKKFSSCCMGSQYHTCNKGKGRHDPTDWWNIAECVCGGV